MIRSQLRRLRAIPETVSPDYRKIFDSYAALLDDVSRRLLDLWNEKHGTAYVFEEVVDGRTESYRDAGILSVLLTAHIPRMVSGEFARLLPEDPGQEYPDARRLRRKFFLHLGDTNTGKTHQALQRLKAAESGVYLAPLRILALENFERLTREGVPCDLLTGEEEFRVPFARHLCCTVEKAVLSGRYDAAVIDEVQLMADSQRGDAWTRAILGHQCPEIHLCGAALAREQLIGMIERCGDTWELKTYTRQTPLRLLRTPVKLTEPQPGDAFVAFSRRRVLALAQQLRRQGVPASVIYGDLPPEVRRTEYDRFISGENPVLAATDAIGMGINLPIRRIIFADTEKFDGETVRPLTGQEVKQIAGRAGRIGIFGTGYVGALDRDALEFLEDRLSREDEPIRQAVVGPSEAILQIGLLPLQQKLALWSARPESLPCYRRKDVRSELLILETLRPYHLPEPVEWRLMSLPFDVENEHLLAQFECCVREHFVHGRTELTRPLPPGPTRGDLEVYYRQIGLYYAFSKNLGLPLDEQWVAAAREQVSGRIRKLLERG